MLPFVTNIVPLFDYREIVARIDDMIEQTGVKKKDVAAAIGMSPSQFSDKRQERANRFTLDELDRLSAFFQRHLERPLPLWPLVSEKQANALGALGVLSSKENTGVD